MDILMLGDKVMVKPTSVKSETMSGIIIPDQAREKPQEGTIIAAREGMEVSVGDRVIFSQRSGKDFEHEGERFLIMKENELYAIL